MNPLNTSATTNKEHHSLVPILSNARTSDELNLAKFTLAKKLSPETKLLLSLAEDASTSPISRNAGASGEEGPAMSFNSTSLRSLLNNNRSKALDLLDLYSTVYNAAFPDPDERLPIRTILTLAENPKLSIDLDIFSSKYGVIGGYQTDIATINNKSYSLGDYLCVSSSFRGQRIGPLVYNATIKKRAALMGAVAHFGEVNDPRRMSAKQQDVDRLSGTTTQARLDFWGKEGRLMLDIPWIQPAIAEGLSTIDYMMLTVHNLDKNKALSITTEIAQAVWDKYYLTLGNTSSVIETRLEMQRLLAPYKGKEIKLLPLDHKRSFIT